MNVISACTLAAGPTDWLVNLGAKPDAAADAVAAALSPASLPAPSRPLQRLGEVRQREGLSRRTLARRLGMEVQEVQKQEQPTSDMLLSDLYRWQEALAVPTAELLNEPDGELSPPVQLRARLLRAMKTVRSIQEVARQVSVRRLVEVLADQLVEVMPELAGAGAWPAVGRRRTQDELGQAFFRGLAFDPRDEPEQPEL
jgi:transcriptional regulator with XRE-family HTH domain